MSRQVALIVGINQYQKNTGLSALTAPVNDANAVYDLLKKYSDFQLVPLPKGIKDDGGYCIAEQALNAEEFVREFQGIFNSDPNLAPQDVLLYFSGHGTRKTGLAQTSSYLACSDDAYAFSLRDLSEAIENSVVQNIVVILDCCHSGEIHNFFNASTNKRFCLIAASSREAEALALQGHSLLTDIVLQALNPEQRNLAEIKTDDLVNFIENYPNKPPTYVPPSGVSYGFFTLTRHPYPTSIKQEATQKYIPYEDWHTQQNEWLLTCLKNTSKSEAAFQQKLAVGENEENLIPRKLAFEKIDSWFQQWTTHHKPLAILGDEGDGKTWAVMAWVYKQLSEKTMPSIVFIPSMMLTSIEPESLIIEMIQRQLNNLSQENLTKSLVNWFQSENTIPLILLIVDGLNEHHNIKWADLITKLSIPPWGNHVAILLTCRTTFWKEKLSYLSSIGEWELTAYSDEELQYALSKTNFSINDFNCELLELVRIPRYFDMVLRLYPRIDTEGEITKERLIYEDWRDQYERKLGRIIDPYEFQELIINLAEKAKKANNLSRKNVMGELSTYEDSHALLAELSSGRILRRYGNHWKINRDHLILGLGLLLATEVNEIENQDEDSIREVIAHHLEPQADMDIKVSICHTALYHAIGEAGLSNIACLALFKAWINGRNFRENDWDAITAYIPVRPELYIDMMEWLWAENTNNIEAQDIFMVGFLKFRKHSKVQTVLVSAFKRWMGFIHPLGCDRKFEDEKIREKSYEAVKKAIGNAPLEIQYTDLLGYRLHIVQDEGLFRLSLFVLAYISHQPRTPYISAIVAGVIAGTVMGYPDFQEKLAWVLRTSPDDIEPPILSISQKLIENSLPTAQKAAWWLLSALSTEKARHIRNQIPQEHHFKSGHRQFYEEHPCDSWLFLWRRNNYLHCLESTNYPPHRIAAMLKEVALNPECHVPRNLPSKLSQAGEFIDLSKIRSSGAGRNSEDHELESIETALCAYNPERYAELLRKLAIQLPERTAGSRKYLMWEIYKHILIMGDIEREAIEKAWYISLETEPKERSDNYSELLLFPSVLRHKTLEYQLELAETRGDRGGYFVNYAPFFKPVDGLENIELITKQLHKLITPKQRYTFLYEIKDSLDLLDEKIFSLLPKFSKIDDSLTRRYALEIIYKSKNLTAINSVLQSDWKANQTENDFEKYWGSILLAENSGLLSFSDLLDRISIELLGHAISIRGNKVDEVLAYAEILHRIWSSIANQSLNLPPEASQAQIETNLLNSDSEFEYRIKLINDSSVTFISWDSIWGGGTWNKNNSTNVEARQSRENEILKHLHQFADTQKKSGNEWFLRSFNKESLREVIEACPNYAEQWLQTALDKENNIIVRCRGFYEAFCEALLDLQPENGAQLFWKIHSYNTFRITDQTTKISLILFKPFKVTDSKPVLTVRKQLLELTISSRDVFEIAFLSQLHDKHDWLNHIISDYLESPHLLEQAKAIYLLGFMDTPESGNKLSAWIEEKNDSRIRDCAQRAKIHHDRNQWAHHWFEKFANHPDKLQAWAAFQLFLKCVDGRFWLWGRETIKAPGVLYERQEHYQTCIASILSAIKENEKSHLKLDKTFLGYDIQKNQLWPWMDNYLEK